MILAFLIGLHITRSLTCQGFKQGSNVICTLKQQIQTQYLFKDCGHVCADQVQLAVAVIFSWTDYKSWVNVDVHKVSNFKPLV